MLINRNLRFLVIGQFSSAIGDHCYLIAMPWLALQISGSAFVAGTLLAVASVPRAAFLLLGGAVTDRYSPRTLLMASNGTQAVLMTVLAAAMLVPFSPLWFLYTMAFLTGLIDAFGLPAFNTLLPQLVKAEELESGNVYLQGANMLSGAIGPALAGLIIARAGSTTAVSTPHDGMAAAFGVNAATFLIGIAFFRQIRSRDDRRAADDADGTLLRAIGRVFDYIRSDAQLRAMFGLMLVLGLFLTGTIRIGFPLLADRLPAGDVRDFGFMSSAFGAGLLAGMLALRLLPRPPASISGIIVLILFGLVPAGLILLGLFPPMALSLAIILAMGAGFGYVMIFLLSWLQRKTPAPLLGRVMAVALFSTIGLAPVSQALMGYLLELGLQSTLIGTGTLVLVLLCVIGADRRIWSLRE